MMQYFKIIVYKIIICDIKFDLILGAWIDSHCVSHLFIHIFKIPYSVSRMKVESDLEISIMKCFKERFVIREQLLIPRIARPSYSPLFVAKSSSVLGYFSVRRNALLLIKIG